MRLVIKSAWLLLVLWYCNCHAAPSCKPQGLLMLDEPYPPPYRVSLPFCQQYHCSCCNVSHALLIQHSLRPVLLDEELSVPCKAGLAKLACKLCDPQVGVGNVSTVCAATCEDVFQACAEDYFAYDESTGLISPCTSLLTGMLLCSRLKQMVKTGLEFCKATGHQPADSSALLGTCFDGSPVAAQRCASAAPPPQPKSSGTHSSRSKWKSKASSSMWSVWPLRKLKRRHKKMLASAAQMILGAVMSALVAFGVVWLLQRVMQPTRAVDVAGSGPVARDRLAHAAEARAAGTAAAAPSSAAEAAKKQKSWQKRM